MSLLGAAFHLGAHAARVLISFPSDPSTPDACAPRWNISSPFTSQ